MKAKFKRSFTPRKIGLPIDVVGAYGRGVVRGIMAYAKPRNWIITVEPRWGLEQIPDVKDWDVEGVIAQVGSAKFQKRVIAQKIPATNVSNFIPDIALPTVIPDDHAVGVLAADYFRGRGFQHFGFCGPPDHGFSLLRLQGFKKRVAEIGGDLHVCDPRKQDMPEWARALPQPVAVMGCNDHWAHRLLNECRRAGIEVPEQIAILGVDNDDLVNTLVMPSLSSIELPTERIGFEAAALLDRLLDGARPPKEPILFAPSGVVTRQSTDVSAIADADVIAALTFIREHADQPIRVEDVLDGVPLGRRTLERRFRLTMGRSILSEIRRAHIERAKQLLTTTQLAMPAIADSCGFSNSSRFGISFHQLTGMTPTEYRRLQSTAFRTITVAGATV
ncbi:MAG: substrate-binding domain-containing protein [Anaerolineae bacterium]|nr:substrate-binding domain-containing protein [Phycisphaerae bacterium]